MRPGTSACSSTAIRPRTASAKSARCSNVAGGRRPMRPTCFAMGCLLRSLPPPSAPTLTATVLPRSFWRRAPMSRWLDAIPARHSGVGHPGQRANGKPDDRQSQGGRRDNPLNCSPPSRCTEPSPRVLLFDGHELEASLEAMELFPDAQTILDAGSLREGRGSWPNVSISSSLRAIRPPTRRSADLE